MGTTKLKLMAFVSFILNSINANVQPQKSIQSMPDMQTMDSIHQRHNWPHCSSISVTQSGFVCAHTHTHKSPISKFQFPKCGVCNCASFSLVFRWHDHWPIVSFVIIFANPSQTNEHTHTHNPNTQISKCIYTKWNRNKIHTGKPSFPYKKINSFGDASSSSNNNTNHNNNICFFLQKASSERRWTITNKSKFDRKTLFAATAVELLLLLLLLSLIQISTGFVLS